MRFHGRVAVDPRYDGLALDNAEGERIARAMNGADVLFLGNHGSGGLRRTDRPRLTTTWLSWSAPARPKCWALSTGLLWSPCRKPVARHVAMQIQGERLQSTLFFESSAPPPASPWAADEKMIARRRDRRCRARQNAGTTAPLYLSRMNCLTFGRLQRLDQLPHRRLVLVVRPRDQHVGIRRIRPR